MGIGAIIGIIIEFLPALTKAAKSVPDVMNFIKKVQEHLKQTKEWTEDQEEAFNRHLEQVTSQEHWKPEKK